ncbi:hypothetical protein, partial [Corynebacterium bovis]|uniref:hypothetical protein n=1 Tax=Corynebacterium bovis TaxID=36808 RepID=UPI001C8CED29
PGWRGWRAASEPLLTCDGKKVERIGNKIAGGPVVQGDRTLSVTHSRSLDAHTVGDHTGNQT